MLADSSVWVPFLRGDVTVEVEMLVAAIKRRDPIWTAPPILREVLQGADSPERFTRWDQVLGELPMLHHDHRAIARSAARLYARCRWTDITPRSCNDCLIAMYALAGQMPLLHRDRDFIAIANVEPNLVLMPH